jgi:hypothetical protein
MKIWTCLRDILKNSQYMKVAKDVHLVFQEECLKMQNNQLVTPHTSVVAYICAAFKIVNLRLEPH